MNVAKRGPKQKVELKMGDVKIKVDHDNNKRDQMQSERSVGYLARMHGRCTENFGEQAVDDRLA